MASILGKKTWRLQDVVLSEGPNNAVRILKLSHPFRRQRITVVPTPPYAKESFYMDWVYQPYVKEHHMYVSNDIGNPLYVFYCRHLLKRDRFPSYAYFHPMGFPDCVELNMTRREFLKRELPFKTPAALVLLTSNRMRDRWHPWVSPKTVKIVGDQYVVHPRAETQSVVFILPPTFVPSLVNTLQSLGFVVCDSATAVIGETATLERLNSWSNKGQLLVLMYLWLLILLFVVGESRHLNLMFQEYKREMVIKAGKDPEKMGL